MTSGYHQIYLAEQDREKTAFSINGGKYEFFRLPFGLKNAGSILDYRFFIKDFVSIARPWTNVLEEGNGSVGKHMPKKKILSSLKLNETPLRV